MRRPLFGGRNKAVPALQGYFVMWSLAVLAVAVTIANFTPLAKMPLSLVAILGWLALLAELFPVEVAGRRIRITFTMPYIAAAAVAIGTAEALVLDVAVTLSAGFVYPTLLGRKVSPPWTLLNAIVSALGCSLAGIVLNTATGHLSPSDMSSVIKGLLYMLVYGGVNFGVVSAVDNYVARRPLSENALSSLKVGAGALSVFTLIALPSVILATHQQLPLLVLTFVPIWALRTGLMYQAKMYNHYYETISSLNLMLQRAHPYTHGHLERVSETAEQVAKRIGLGSKRARMVREAALLHDIGKIAVSEEILDKPGKLNDEEFSHVRMHAKWGADILRPCRQFSTIVPWILHHHERPDGKGYPEGLSGNKIPVESRIIAIVDAFDAMIGGPKPGEKRTYREPMSVEQALMELERCAGTQFDAAIVEVFKEVVISEGGI